jgi:UDP-2-acetamido-3-amino-2,3-dideoxy-glucuronate N-acetyltransferase
VRDCWIERLPHFADMRGSLIAMEISKGLPFVPKRVFMVYDVPSHHVRGEHAHLQCKQFLIAIRGGVSIVLDDGVNCEEVRLSEPSTGLYLPPMVWGIQYKFDADCILVVAASDTYDKADYIRDYSVFLDAARTAHRR